MESRFQKIASNVFAFYLVSVFIVAPIFNWRYANDHGFVSWVCFGGIVATAKAMIWPYYAVTGSDKESALTSEERAFAEQWNQWVDDHSEEINDLRTRAIAGDLTEEEVKREAIGLMVRFSNEANLDIPQRFIDDIKKGDGKD